MLSRFFSSTSTLLSEKNEFFIGQSFSILIGIFVYILFFDIAILDPSNFNWILNQKDDILQHQLGSMSFRKDEWYFPITLTKEINFPEGISIVYTDSNILLSLLTKVFRFVFLPQYQFWGLWFLLCLVLQSLFAFQIMYKITNNLSYSLLSASFFCLLPTLFQRIEMGHSNLFAHWLILLIIGNLLNDKQSLVAKDSKNWLILILCSSIHGYLMIMCLIIVGVYLAQRLVNLYKEGIKGKILFFGSNVLGALGFISALWALGYFYNQPINFGLLGFGDYSMNLNSLINPLYDNLSIYLPILPMQNTQYEGYQYLGLGVIILHVFFLVHYFMYENSYKKWGFYALVFLLILISGFFLFFHQELLYQYPYFILASIFLILISNYGVSLNYNYSTLLIAAFVSFFISLSNIVYLDSTKILKFELLEERRVELFLQMIRSSGRFYWVTGYVFLILILKYIYTSFKIKKYVILVLIVAFGFQLSDVILYEYSKKSGSNAPVETKVGLDKILKGTQSVSFIEFFDMHTCRDVLLLNKNINKFYMAHGNGQQSADRISTESLDFQKGVYTENHGYLLNELSYLPHNQLCNVVQIDSVSYLFTNNLKTSIPKELPNNLKIVNHTFSKTEFREKLKDPTLLINLVNDQLFFKNQEISTDLNSFSFEAKEDKNQILHQPNTKTNLTNSSFVLQMSNQVVNIKKISNSSESGMFLYIDDMRITRLKSGISYLSIDKEGIIHLAYVTF